MNIVCSGTTYQVYDNGITTYQTLPAQVYTVGFNKMSGFFLSVRPTMIVNEKMYGNYVKKVDKILRGYQSSNRNFGTILSGPKGVGKSLFAKVLSVSALDAGLPVILVSDYIPGIANFLTTIDQDVVVLFDEFEKTFADRNDCYPQDEMLPLFDGLEDGHKLFVVICNEVCKLSDYFTNRPGRFHYHLVFSLPTAEEITEYLADKLLPQYHNMITDIVRYAKFGYITYDCLRAIAFDLNMGYSLAETMEDLNVVKKTYIRCNVLLEMNDGTVHTGDESLTVHLSGNHLQRLCLYQNNNKLVRIQVEFTADLIQPYKDTSNYAIDPQKLRLDIWNDWDDETDKKATQQCIESGVKSCILVPRRTVEKSSF